MSDEGPIFKYDTLTFFLLESKIKLRKMFWAVLDCMEVRAERRVWFCGCPINVSL